MMPLPRFTSQMAQVHSNVQQLADFLAWQVLRSKAGEVNAHVFEFKDDAWPELVPELRKVGAEDFPKHCKRIIQMFSDYLETYVNHLNEADADGSPDDDVTDVQEYIDAVTELRSTLQPLVEEWDSAAQAACAKVLSAFRSKDPDAVEFDEDGNPIGYDTDGNAIDSDGNIVEEYFEESEHSDAAAATAD
jgi:hypothetical protein